MQSSMQFSIVLGAIFLLSLVFPSISHNPGKDYLVCKKLENIFDVESNINQSEITGNSRGKPGKRGPPGLKGPPGPTGPIGQVDYEKVNRILEERFLRIRSKALNTNLFYESVWSNNMTKLASSFDLTLSIDRNPFLEKNQTQRSYRVYISPTR